MVANDLVKGLGPWRQLHCAYVLTMQPQYICVSQGPTGAV